MQIHKKSHLINRAEGDEWQETCGDRSKPAAIYGSKSETKYQKVLIKTVMSLSKVT